MARATSHATPSRPASSASPFPASASAHLAAGPAYVFPNPHHHLPYFLILLDHRLNDKDDHLQFNKIDKIDERSMDQVQQGVGAYNDGVKALKNKEYTKAIDDLKEAEKRLKRGKITEDGLNFVRGNLAIAYLSKGDKRGLGQAKRYLKYLTKQIYKTRDWTYNLAVDYYTFGDKEKALSLFILATKQDRLY